MEEKKLAKVIKKCDIIPKTEMVAQGYILAKAKIDLAHAFKQIEFYKSFSNQELQELIAERLKALN